MTLTTVQAFDTFMESISITDYQRATHVNARATRVAQNLTTAFPGTSDLPFLSSQLIGSASKGTIVRPLDDIDVLAIFSNAGNVWQSKYWNNSQGFLYRVRKAYDGLSTQQVGARGQAVRVFFQSGGHVDVAPVFKADENTFLLPSGSGGWINTSPFVANAWLAGRNRDLDYNLTPLIRMLKKWNRAHSKRLRSFHLETMVASAFSRLSSNRRTGLQSFFEYAPQHIDVGDPGGQSGVLSGYLSWSSREAVKQSFATAHDRASRAIEAEDAKNHTEAKRLWRIVLGDYFPTA